MIVRWLVLLLCCFAAHSHALEITSPQIALKNISTEVTVGAEPGEKVELLVDGNSRFEIANADGVATFEDVIAKTEVRINPESQSKTLAPGQNLRLVSGWLSILPPFLAIILALWLRSVIPALFVGIWAGATTLVGFSPWGLFKGLLNGFEVYVTKALADPSHAQIMLFSFMIGGMVGIVTRSGGMAAIVNSVIRRAKNAITGQVAIWAMGLVIFFDDYSNTLVVGNTARPIADKLKISREKLAYIVDSTSAPVATIGLITTWIGYQIGLIKDAVELLPGYNEPAYSIFLNSIPYSFYPVFAIIFVLAVASTGRDFGPMLKAERRVRSGEVDPIEVEKLANDDGLHAKEGVKARAIIAILPVVVLIAGLLIGLYATGSSPEHSSIREIIGNSDSYKALMWASLCSVMVAAALAIGFKTLTVHETVDAWYRGVRAMLLAMTILVLAWALSAITADLHTADFLISILKDSLPLALVPAAIFIVSALTAFSTGTSWGTMGILMPLIIPLAWAILQVNGAADPTGYHILYSAVACNLAGAVWGDHCSPISDTTVLSSLASGCDHIEHVRTQLPYAMTVGSIAMVVGTIPTGFGLPWWISMIIGVTALLVILRFVGKHSDLGAAA